MSLDTDEDILRVYKENVGKTADPDTSRSVLVRLLNSDTPSRLALKCAIALMHEWCATRTEWVDYIVLLEALSEPQAHIVQPVLVKYASLVYEIRLPKTDDTSASIILDLEFLLIAFHRALIHTNGWIRFWAMQNLLKLIKPEEMIEHMEFFLTKYLLRFNDTDFFSRLMDTSQLDTYVHESLHNYIRDLIMASKEPLQQLYSLCQVWTSMMWSPAASYYYSAVLNTVTTNMTRLHASSSDASWIELVKLALERIANMQVPCIRSAVQHHMIRVFVNIFDFRQHSRLGCLHIWCNLLRSVSSYDQYSVMVLDALDQCNVDDDSAEDLLNYCFSAVDEVEIWSSCLLELSTGNVPDPSDAGTEFTSLLKLAYFPQSDLPGGGSISKQYQEHLLDEDCGCERWAVETYLDRVLTNGEFELVFCLCEHINAIGGLLGQMMMVEEHDLMTSCFMRVCAKLDMNNDDVSDTLVFCLSLRLIMCVYRERDLTTNHIGVVNHSILPNALLDSGYEMQTFLEAVQEHLTRLPAALPDDKLLLNRMRSDLISDGVAFKSMSCIARMIEVVTPADVAQVTDAIDLVVEPSALRRLIHVIRQAMEYFAYNSEQVVCIVEALAKAVADQRNADTYWPVLDAFVELLTIRRLVYTKDEAINACLTRLCADHLLATSCSTTSQWVLARNLYVTIHFKSRTSPSRTSKDRARSRSRGLGAESADIGTLTAGWANRALVTIALMSPVLRKGEKVHEQCERDIVVSNSTDAHCTANTSVLHAASAQRARVQACATIAHMPSSVEVVNMVIEEAKLMNMKGHFGLSHEHRLKTRALCLLLYLVVKERIPAESLDGVYNMCVNTLRAEASQTSIRLLCELIVVVVCSRDPIVFDRFVDQQFELFNARVGAVASWMQILMLLALTNQSLYHRVFTLCLQWVSALNLHVRCTALAVCRHLLNKIQYEEKSPEELFTILDVDVGPLIQMIFTEHDVKGSQCKIVHGLLEDEFFTNSPPAVDFDEEYIFFKVPYLCGLTSEELLPECFWRCCLLPKPDTDNDQNPSIEQLMRVEKLFTELRKTTVTAVAWRTVWKGDNSNPKQSAERCDQPLLFSENSTTTADTSGNFQRKLTVPVILDEDYTPVDNQAIDKEPTTADSTSTTTHDEPTTAIDDPNAPSLVVIASLIDKPSNIGGLCRTCEIFGASKLVVGDLGIKQHSEFKSLCVNADKWVDIEQVNPKWLDEYLVRLKTEGYTIVGIEQMSNSQSLTEYKLPPRCALLLGTERQGIPPSLIGHLDAAVEIPQLGVVRSLNVHVCGALVIYEYVRQHRL